MSLFDWIDFKEIGSDEGKLVAIESGINIPFDIKRVYYLTSLKSSVPRGFHAHKKLIQIAFCLSGSCDMIFDSGAARETVTMDSTSRGLVIKPLIWHEMHNFSDNCVFMVLASEHYDELDYIRDYDDFLRFVTC
jgi:dTDP-4-dehydrorhamnose 3,5-epimerase-like enzyme